MTHTQDTTTMIAPAGPHNLDQRRTVGEQANNASAAGAFAGYTKAKARNTTRRQFSELAVFARYLAEAGFYAGDDPAEADFYGDELDKARAARLQSSGMEWAGITHGLVDGFVQWQLLQGHAIGTVNIRLSTVKRYAGLAFKAGAIDHTTYALIKLVQGYTRNEAIHVDEQRQQTRAGAKKATATKITDGQASRLKDQPLDTPQGRRDAVIMTILLDHGLRVGELVGLQVSAVDFEHRQLVFYRPKVNKTQTHDLTEAAYTALLAWRDSGDMPLAGSLLRGSRKGGKLTGVGMTERAINARVQALGAAAGIANLSPHDCRHYWATVGAQKVEAGRATLFNLQEAGGWNSLAMPRRYVEAAAVANKNLV